MKTQDLHIWQKGMEVVRLIYGVTDDFPEEEKFGLTSQIRRASVSVVSNIAEGNGRKSSKEFSHFLSNALGSLSELETQLLIAENLKFCPEQVELKKMVKDLFFMIIGFQKTLTKTRKNSVAR